MIRFYTLNWMDSGTLGTRIWLRVRIIDNSLSRIMLGWRLLWMLETWAPVIGIVTLKLINNVHRRITLG